MVEPIKTILMRRDGMSAVEADLLIGDAKRDLNYRLDQGEQPYDICAEWFGLEPDYLEELLPL